MPKQARLEPLTIRAEMLADDSSAGNVYINGPIIEYAYPDYYNETSAFSARKALEAVESAKTLNVYIDSPGGYLDEAMTIMREIGEHPATQKNAYIMECASAATLLTLPCNKVYIYDGGEVMIHNPRGGMYGTPKEIINYGEGLQKRADTVAAMYAKRMNKTTEEAQAMMDAETWMTPQEAVDNGFAHEIIPVVAGAGVMMSADDEAQRAALDKFFGYTNRPASRGRVCHMAKAQTPAFFAIKDAPPSGAGSEDNDRKDEKGMTLDELKKNSPELYNQILDEGRKMERERIKGLDDISDADCAEMIYDAKYGENPCSAAEIAVRVLMESRKKKASGESEKKTPAASFIELRKNETAAMDQIAGESAKDNDPGAGDDREIKAFASMCNQHISVM